MTHDLFDAELDEFLDDVATHLPTVRMAREIQRRRAGAAPPAGIVAGIDRYCLGVASDNSCLRSILQGDLFGAFARADPDTAAAMGAIVMYISRRLPSSTYGSPEAVSRYLEQARRALEDAP